MSTDPIPSKFYDETHMKLYKQRAKAESDYRQAYEKVENYLKERGLFDFEENFAKDIPETKIATNTEEYKRLTQEVEDCIEISANSSAALGKYVSEIEEKLRSQEEWKEFLKESLLWTAIVVEAAVAFLI